MVASELKHPRIRRGGHSQKRDVVEVASESRRRSARSLLPELWSWRARSAGRRSAWTPWRASVSAPRGATPRASLRSIGLEVIVGLSDLLHFFQALWTQHCPKQIHRGFLLVRR